MTSYLSENEAKIFKMVTSMLLKFLTMKWIISRTICRLEVSDDSFYCIFHALSFELNFFRPEFPSEDLSLLNVQQLIDFNAASIVYNPVHGNCSQ